MKVDEPFFYLEERCRPRSRIASSRPATAARARRLPSTLAAARRAAGPARAAVGTRPRCCFIAATAAVNRTGGRDDTPVHAPAVSSHGVHHCLSSFRVRAAAVSVGFSSSTSPYPPPLLFSLACAISGLVTNLLTHSPPKVVPRDRCSSSSTRSRQTRQADGAVVGHHRPPQPMPGLFICRRPLSIRNKADQALVG